MGSITPRLAASLFVLPFMAIARLSGCAAPPAAPSKNTVQLTTDSTQLHDCQGLDEIHLSPPFGRPQDWQTRLQTAVQAAGGNAAYLHAPGDPPKEVAARAYLCPEKPSLSAGVHAGEAPDIPPDFPQRRFAERP